MNELLNKMDEPVYQQLYTFLYSQLSLFQRVMFRLRSWRDGAMYALGLLAALRSNRLDEITALIDAGTAGFLRIYDGARPATGGAATTLLAELTFSVTSFPAASAGAMTANAITDDSSADAAGTATWFRVVDSAATFVFDGDVGTSGSDLNLNAVAIALGAVVSVTSMVLTDGNA